MFGCSYFPYLRPYDKHKLEFRTERCVFIGYSPHHKVYQCLHSSGKVYISNHVVFDENSFPYQPGVDFSSIQESCSSQSTSSSHSTTETSSSMMQAFLASSSTSNLPASSSSQVSHSLSLVDLLVVSFSNQSEHSSPTNNTSLNNTLPRSPSLPHNLPLPQPLGHPMITRSKAGIFKPKIYLAALLSTPIEPTSVS